MDWSCVFPYKDKDGNAIASVATLDCLPPLIVNLINWALALSGLVALIFIIIAGYKFITSGGDPKQADSAKKTATFSIAGLILILLSFTIINFIADFTGVSCIKGFGFDTCQGHKPGGGRWEYASCYSTEVGGTCDTETNCNTHGLRVLKSTPGCGEGKVCCKQ